MEETTRMQILIKEQKPGRRLLQHAIFWTVLLLFNVSRFQRSFVGYSFELFKENLITELLELPILMMAGYFTAYYLLERYFIPRKYFSFFSLLLLSSLVFAIIMRIHIIFIEVPLLYPETEKDSLNFLHFNIIQYVFYIYSAAGILFMLRLVKHLYRVQEAKSRAEEEKTKSELALLRAQVNPHFLFNTLNNIHSQIRQDADAASKAVIKLSDIMRFMFEDARNERIPLSREARHIRDYIDLQKLRLSRPDIVDFQTSGPLASALVPPLLLVPFVENAFKHGHKNPDAQGIYIRLELNNNEILFECKNQIKDGSSTLEEHGNGFGIMNVRKRLALIYREKYSLSIREENQIFTVLLRIQR